MSLSPELARTLSVALGVKSPAAEVFPEPLYQASRDGWQASTFHAKCDNVPDTVTLLWSSDG